MSRKDSPLLALLDPAAKVNTSALMRRAASSKLVRVRVLFSKKAVQMVWPCSAGTFFTGRSST